MQPSMRLVVIALWLLFSPGVGRAEGDTPQAPPSPNRPTSASEPEGVDPRGSDVQAAPPTGDGKDSRADAADSGSDDVDPERRAMARKHYREGQRLFRKGRFREAIPALGKAAALWPRPEIYFNMALCHLELGERIEAATFLRRYLAGTNPAERRALPKPLRDLLAEMGVVVVRVSHREAEIWMNGRLRGRAFLEQVVLPGEVAVEVRMEGRPVVSKLLRVEPGQVVLWELDAGMLKVAGGRREPGGSRGDAGQGSASGEGGAAKLWRSRPRHHLAWFAGVGGLALVSAGAALILGVQTRAIHRDYLRDPSWPRRDLGLGYQTATNALWGLAGAAAVSAAVLALFTRFRSEGPDGPRRFGAEKVSLNLAVAPGGVEIFGTF